MFVNKSSVKNDPEYRVKLKTSNARHYFILISLMVLGAVLTLCAGNFEPAIMLLITTLLYAVLTSIITGDSVKTILLNSSYLYKCGAKLVFSYVWKLISTR